MINRSQLLLDIEHDLNRISQRLHTLEDHFEHDGVITRIAETLHQLATEVEQIKARVVDGDVAE